MAEVIYRATPADPRRQAHRVERATAEGLLDGAHVAIVFDNSISKLDLAEALNALRQALGRQSNQATAPAGYAAAGREVL